MFDDSIDFVLWGHEHDCRVMPEEVIGKNYRICQPGSSVATSLADGESLEKYASCPASVKRLLSLCSRQVALLEVQGKEYKLTPIPLRTVRPFVIDEVVLQDAAELEEFDLNDREAVTAFLKSAVSELPVWHGSSVLAKTRDRSKVSSNRQTRCGPKGMTGPSAQATKSSHACCRLSDTRSV